MDRSDRRSGGTPCYQPLGWFVVRTPLLPIADYLTLGDAASEDLLAADPRVERALAVGGGDLVRAVQRPGTDQRARQRAARKLQRYLIRMSSRPTPFGLFAGVGIAAWGERTDLQLAQTAPHIRTRPDMGWLIDLVASLEREPRVRSELRWFVHPAAFVAAGRLFLSERAPLGEGAALSQDGCRATSVRATATVRAVLEAARVPVPYQNLVDELSIRPGATPTKVRQLLDQLIEQTLLLSDLRPPLTTASPARYVTDRLRAVPAASHEAAALTDLLEQLDTWDRLDAGAGAAAYPKLVTQAESLHAADQARGPFQTDMALPLAGRRLHRSVAVEAARAVDLLLRLSSRAGTTHLAAYRGAFAERYEPDREVPLLELLDPDVGLGPPAATPRRADRPEQQQRERTLTDLALSAIRERTPVIELDQQTISALDRGPLAAPHLPSSLDMSLFVLAVSPAAIDAGDFRVVVGPNLGAAAAGRGLGRFADLLGPDAIDVMRTAAAAESATRPGRLWAEVTYLPRPGRVANVAVRPLVRAHEIGMDTAATGSRIPLAELVVGLRDERFVLRWPARDAEIVPCAGHMLNTLGAPTVVRFLEDIAEDGRVLPGPFDWGPAAGFPFLPRVQVDRIVLSPARWQVDWAADVTAEKIGEWRQRWQVPRYVHLGRRDNRLLLDLDAPRHVEQIRAEATTRASGDPRLTFHEALPAPADVWLPGPGGAYVSEIVVPLVRNAPEDAPSTAIADPPPVGAATDRRRHPPGSDWLYAKLYHLPPFEEDLLAGPIREFCTQAATDGLVRRWFVIRYADPDPHLRIRWQGDPRLLVDVLAPRLLRWGSALVTSEVCRRLVLDTYEREVERYGGPAAMELAEEMFTADTEAVLELLHMSGRHFALDRALLGVHTADDLLAGLGLTAAEREQLYRTAVVDRRAGAVEYRQHQSVLRELLGDPDWLCRQSDGAAVAEVLDRRRVRIRDVASQIDALDAAGQLGRSRLDLARSAVHMHCNRLLGCGHPAEQRTLGLLLRARESLRRAPVGRGTA